ncbi:MAG: phosphate starvation-inducible protein PhoH [Sorangiineae bacterium NIC37A_2]|jgi:PhoH-like ATPase|nr:MAG: phosphate starvation-inducible protein PhoH [Sorangiineae bacterium NIC37A_2]
MKKNYVLDTNVLLHDPQCIYKFEDNDLYVPIYVIEEIDTFKRDTGERGRNARSVVRNLDALREGGGTLAAGVPVGDGGSLRVYVPDKKSVLAVALKPSAGDNAILQAALDIRDAAAGKKTVFVTMDVSLRIRADALGLETEAYENQTVDPDRLKSGITELSVSPEELQRFFKEGRLEIPNRDIPANGSVMLCELGLQDRTGLGRFDPKQGAVRQLITPREGIAGIRPRNREQAFALDLLLDDSVKLVTLIGSAGTGKTLLALAAGLSRVVEGGAFTRLLISRPVMPLGRDLGYLPGDVDEKLGPWMQPLYDNLEYLLVAGGGKRRGFRGFEELLDSGQIQVEPLTYIRGRSLPAQFVIVDEAQNLTPHEVKTVVTRCGEGTKIVLTGDPYQIDNPYVDATSNGLSLIADRLRDETIAGHVLLTKGERSELSNLAASKL